MLHLIEGIEVAVIVAVLVCAIIIGSANR